MLLVEHRLEEVFPIADKVLLMDKGRVLLYDTPRDVGRSLAASHPMQLGLPAPSAFSTRSGRTARVR